MKQRQISSMTYPRVFYSPELQHCAFNLTGMGEIAVKPTIDKSLPNANELSDAWFTSLSAKFPSQEQFATALPDSYLRSIQTFVGIKDKFKFALQSDAEKPAVVAFCNALPFCPVVQYKVEYGFIGTDMHNAATSQLGFGLAACAMPLLSTICGAYGTQTELIPTFTFDRTSVKICAQVPFASYARELNPQLFQAPSRLVKLETTRLDDGLFGYDGKDALVYSKNNYLVAEIDSKKMAANKKADLAFALLELITMQCSQLLLIGENANK